MPAAEVKELANAALRELSPVLDEIHSAIGRSHKRAPWTAVIIIMVRYPPIETFS